MALVRGSLSQFEVWTTIFYHYIAEIYVECDIKPQFNTAQ